MSEPSNLRSLRLAFSLAAAGGAILLCTALNHFSPSLADPASFLLAAQHRCGRVLLVALTWAALESITYLALPNRYRTQAS